MEGQQFDLRIYRLPNKTHVAILTFYETDCTNDGRHLPEVWKAYRITPRDGKLLDDVTSILSNNSEWKHEPALLAYWRRCHEKPWFRRDGKKPVELYNIGAPLPMHTGDWGTGPDLYFTDPEFMRYAGFRFPLNGDKLEELHKTLTD